MTTNTEHEARQSANDLRAKAGSLADEARSTASATAARAQAEIEGRAAGAKDGVADEVNDVASALRKAAGDMRGGSVQERTMSQIASGLADVSETIRGKDLSELSGDLSAFARRNPVAFLGGAALLGFAATRFAKATRPVAEPAARGTYAATPGPRGYADTTNDPVYGSTPPVTGSPAAPSSPAAGAAPGAAPTATPGSAGLASTPGSATGGEGGGDSPAYMRPEDQKKGSI